MAADLDRYLENWQEEVDSSSQYRLLASLESDTKLKKVYENLARMEDVHVAFWEGQITTLGGKAPNRVPSWRSRTLQWFARRLGPQFILSTVAEKERSGQNTYVNQPETKGTTMTGQEHSHTRILEQLLKTQKAGVSGSFLCRVEGRHGAVGGNALRAAVLGANDGLCSNMSLVMGVAGASANQHSLVVTGLAGLLAGACSMALGEWISVTSSRELAEREIRIESSEVEMDPAGERAELQLIYESKGLSPDAAQSLAAHMMSNPVRAVEALTREELGIDPDDLGGRAMEAALFSFFLFALGAIVPVFPLLVFPQAIAIWASIAASGAALFGFGALITLFTGKSVWVSGGRQLLLGSLAAGVTFILGHLIGAQI